MPDNLHKFFSPIILYFERVKMKAVDLHSQISSSVTYMFLRALTLVAWFSNPAFLRSTDFRLPPKSALDHLTLNMFIQKCLKNNFYSKPLTKLHKTVLL